MSDVHTTVTGARNEVTIVFHNPAIHPLAPNAGVPAVPATKTPGNPNGAVHGQTNVGGVVPGPVVNNPA